MTEALDPNPLVFQMLSGLCYSNGIEEVRRWTRVHNERKFSPGRKRCKKGLSLPPGYTGIVKDIEKGCTSDFEL